MQIVSTSAYRDFQILDGHKVLELKYEGWFSKKASASYGGQQIEIRSKSFWGSKYAIFKNGQEVGIIRFNWSGQSIIALDGLANDTYKYKLKPRFGWKPHFEVYDGEGELLFKMHYTAKWYSSRMAYEVDKAQLEPVFDEYEILLYCGFAANKLLANRAAG